MSQSLPERADVRQLRIQAKELLRALNAGESEAVALAATHDPSLAPSSAKLADAQRLVARRYGFDSWPKLVAEVETPALIEQMKLAVEEGDAGALEKLFKAKPVLRKHIEDPIFSFDAPAFVRASYHPKAAQLLPVLARHGANPNSRSKWWAGGFGALDHANPATAEILVNLGTHYDVWSAAAHGKTEILAHLLDADPSLVNAPGGDGERPLHFASSPEVAELLISRGADLEIRDVDHESTPLQYHVRKPEIARMLLAHGAKPDIFTAVMLDDAAMVRAMLSEDPSLIAARVGSEPFVTRESNGGHIYTYLIGGGLTPLFAAAKYDCLNALKVLEAFSAPAQRLVAAAWREDSEQVRALLTDHPELSTEAGQTLSHALPAAAQEGRAGAVKLLMEAGIDPLTTGMDSGTPLHIACWYGYVDVVRLLIDRVPLEQRDQVHGSTPLGWALHGSHWCRNAKGDYPAVVETLIAAGADLNAPANKNGTSMLAQAGNREDVKEVLRRHGAA